MLRVSELRLVRPIEVAWDGAYPVPRITLRNPDKVSYDPETRLLHVDTGRALVLMPLDAESVDRMVLEPTAPQASPAPTTSTPPLRQGSVTVRKGGAR